MDGNARAVVLDLDGTLVDSVHHHVTAWHRALLEHDAYVPMARIHAGIGMGGDRLVAWLLGQHHEDASGISTRHRRLFLDVADTLQPTPGAGALLEDLRVRELPHVIATSAGEQERAALLRAIGDPDVAVFDADQVEASKPAPDLVLAACEELDVAPADAIVVGDTPWDARAARRAGASSILVRCGGFPDADLWAARPEDVVDDPRDLISRL